MTTTKDEMRKRMWLARVPRRRAGEPDPKKYLTNAIAADFVQCLGDLQRWLETRGHYVTLPGDSDLTCPLCGSDVKIDTKEYTYHGWSWFSGYAHNVAVHDIRPSRNFVRFVTNADQPWNR